MFWAECNIFGLQQKRIKQKKEEERVAELKLKNVWAEKLKNVWAFWAMLGCNK